MSEKYVAREEIAKGLPDCNPSREKRLREGPNEAMVNLKIGMREFLEFRAGATKIPVRIEMVAEVNQDVIGLDFYKGRSLFIIGETSGGSRVLVVWQPEQKRGEIRYYA